MFAGPARHSRVLRLVGFGMLLAVLVVAVNPAPATASGRDGVRVTRDLPYGTDRDEELLLDVYRPPAATSPSPMLILIHGGGWASGDKERYEPFSRALAVAGFVVFDINYSLDLSVSPGYPRQVKDVDAALAWVQEHAAEFGGDTDRIAVAGGSAGGYLAAMLGTHAPSVRAVVSLSGPMDLMAAVADLRVAGASAPGQCAPADCAVLQRASERLRSLLGCDPLQCPEQLLREASPITYVTSDSPPFFLANGTEESVPATQATLMASALRARGVPVELELVPGDEHSVEYVASVERPLLAFLRTHVAGSPPATESSTVTNAPQDGQRRGWVRPWFVGTAALCLLAAVAVARRRRRASVRAEIDRGDLVEPSSRSGDRS
jgi:acetyl esterase